MREKLRARIAETLALPAPDKAAAAVPEAESGVLVLEPIVVTEARGVREPEKALAEDRQRQEVQRFGPLKGAQSTAASGSKSAAGSRPAQAGSS